MGPRAAEAKSLYFEPSKRRLIAPPGPERQPMESWSLRESPNSLTATAVRRDDDTLHARFEDSLPNSVEIRPGRDPTCCVLDIAQAAGWARLDS